MVEVVRAGAQPGEEDVGEMTRIGTHRSLSQCSKDKLKSSKDRSRRNKDGPKSNNGWHSSSNKRHNVVVVPRGDVERKRRLLPLQPLQLKKWQNQRVLWLLVSPSTWVL